MIRLEGITKTYRLNGQAKTVANNITCTFPSRTAVAIFGRNGAGKSTLLRIIAGTQEFDAGRVTVQGTVSWPVGFSGSFHGDMTGAQNTRFVARIAGVDTDELVDYVRDFAELGAHYYLPVRTYSSGMRSRLAFGVSMGIKFDTYLVDEATAAGDQIFKQKAQEVFTQRMRDSGMVFVTHSLGQAKAICQHGAVLEDGRLHYYTKVDDALAHHLENVRRAQAEAGR
ncbi:MAG: ABC transporter ATP-binding protein [Gemmobacter sp.]